MNSITCKVATIQAHIAANAFSLDCFRTPLFSSPNPMLVFPGNFTKALNNHNMAAAAEKIIDKIFRINSQFILLLFNVFY